MKRHGRVIPGVRTFVLHALLSLFLLVWQASSANPSAIGIILLVVLTFPLNLLALLLLMLGAGGPIGVIVLVVANSVLWAWLMCRFWPTPKLDHRLCTACGYDLRGGVSDECPECGEPLESIQITLLSRQGEEESSEEVLAELMVKGEGKE